MLLFFINSASYSTELLVEPYQILFDYDSLSHHNDALSVSDAGGTTITEAEWYHGDEISNPAYIKGQSNRKIKVLFDSQYTGIAHLIITVSYASGSSYGIGTICNLFVANFDLGIATADTLTIQFTETLPNYVGKHTFAWKWEIYAIPVGTTSYCAALNTTYTNHSFYTLLAEPKAPMAKPWTSVLDHACSWASGQTTATGIMQKVVEGLYNTPEFKYHIGGGASRYTGSKAQNFNLTLMLSDFGGSDIPVNCYDMGKSVNIYSNAIGCNSNYVFTNPFGYVNCIKPIGHSWTNNPFYVLLNYPYNIPVVGEDLSYPKRTQFSNHAFCMLGDIVYDACLTVDVDSNPDTTPCIESWATGWNWATYKNKVIDDIPSSTPGSPSPYNFSVY